MVLAFPKERECIGSCKGQIALIRLDRTFVTFANFLKAVSELEPKEVFKPLLQLLTLIENNLTFVELRAQQLNPREIETIRELIMNYRGQIKCDLFFVLSGGVIEPSALFHSRYLQKLMVAGITHEKRGKYQLIVNKMNDAEHYIPKLHDQLLIISNQKQPDLKPQQLTAEDRARRGYDQTEGAIIQSNVEYLRKGFLPEFRKIEVQMTMGRYSSIPGMYQDHCVLSVDTLTGKIFWPSSIKRHAQPLAAPYEQQEEDATTLDYVFGIPNPRQEQIITLPPGYAVLPTEFLIREENLSADARRVLHETKKELFIPILPDLEHVRDRIMDPKLKARITKFLEGYYRV